MKCARLAYWNAKVPFTVSSTFAEPDTPNILLPFTMFSGFKLASPATCTAPVVYLPEATAVCVEVPGVTVFTPCVVSCCVALFVPSATMPPTCAAVAVISPPEDTEIDGVACSTSGSVPVTTLPSGAMRLLPLLRSIAVPGFSSVGSCLRTGLFIMPHRLPARGLCKGYISPGKGAWHAAGTNC